MGRPKSESRVREMFSNDIELNSSRCLICDTVIASHHLGNQRKHLKRHYEKVLNAIEIAKPPIRVQKRIKKKITLEYDVQDLIDSWLDLIIKEGRPFTLLNSKALRRIVQPIFDTIGEKLITSTEVADAIHEKAEKMRDEIRHMCFNRVVSIKIDGASRHLRRVLCVNSQFVIDNKIVVRTLAMKEINRRHTALNIKDFVRSTLRRYNINIKQVYSATQDNGSNMIAAAKLLNYTDSDEEDQQMNIDEPVPHDEEMPATETTDEESQDYEIVDDVDGVKVIRCAAHTAELGARDTLDKLNIKRIVAKFRTLALHLRIPTNVSLLRSKGLPLPKTDSKPRWHTSYDMALSLKRLRQFCESNEIKILNRNDWEILDIFLKVFKPMKIALKKLQDEQLCLGDFFKVWLDLTLRIQKMNESDDTKVFAQELYKNLMERERLLFEENKALQAALYLDPRFRRIMEKIRPNYFNVAEAQQHLLSLYEQITKLEKEAKEAQEEEEHQQQEEHQEGHEANYIDVSQSAGLLEASSSEQVRLLKQPSTSSSDSVPTSDPDSEDSTLQSYIDALYADVPLNHEQDKNEDIASAFATICMYNDKKPLNTDVLKYWYEKRFSHPTLYKLASIVHGVPATQVTVERCFSGLHFILSDCRTRMGEDVLEDLMLLYLNLNH